MTVAQQKSVYAAEKALHRQSRQFATLEEATEWMSRVLVRHDIDADIEVKEVAGKWSGCDKEAHVMWLTRPFRASVICHELAHFIVNTSDHDEEFADAYLTLVREEIGFFEYAELRQELMARGF